MKNHQMMPVQAEIKIAQATEFIQRPPNMVCRRILQSDFVGNGNGRSFRDEHIIR